MDYALWRVQMTFMGYGFGGYTIAINRDSKLPTVSISGEGMKIGPCPFDAKGIMAAPDEIRRKLGRGDAADALVAAIFAAAVLESGVDPLTALRSLTVGMWEREVTQMLASKQVVVID